MLFFIKFHNIIHLTILLLFSTILFTILLLLLFNYFLFFFLAKIVIYIFRVVKLAASEREAYPK